MKQSHVMLRPAPDHTTIRGTAFFDFVDDYHVSTTGEIVALPEDIRYNGLLLENLPFLNHKNFLIETSAPWLTDIELSIGDKVFFRYIENTEKNEVYLGGERFLIMPYTSIICVYSPEIKPVNGRILLSMIDSDSDFMGKRPTLMAGIVRYAGMPNIHYLSGHQGDGIQFAAGQKVLFKYANVTLLEHPDFQILDEQFYVIQDRDVQALLYEQTTP